MAKTPTEKNGGRTTRKTNTPGEAPRRPVAVMPVAQSQRTDSGDIEEQIRQRAYELYEQEGRQDGRDQEYWLRAEAEIRGRRTA